MPKTQTVTSAASTSSSAPAAAAANHTITSKMVNATTNSRLPSGLVMKPNTTGYDVIKPSTAMAAPGNIFKNSSLKKTANLFDLRSDAPTKHVGFLNVCVNEFFHVIVCVYEIYNIFTSHMCVCVCDDKKSETAGAAPSLRFLENTKYTFELFVVYELIMHPYVY